LIFVIVILLLIALNGYFSLAEIALVSVKRSKLKIAAEKGNKKARVTIRLLDDPEEFLSSVQVGITLVGIVEGLYGGEKLAAYVEPVLDKWGLGTQLAHIVSLVASIGFITYITIVIGELLPKSVALHASYKTALLIGPSLAFFTRLAYPFVRLLTVSTHWLLKLLRIRSAGKEQISEADLKFMLGTAYKEGVLEKAEWQLHENVFNFNDITADRIMTPRHQVVCIDADWPHEVIAEVLKHNSYAHVPVYQGSKDRITGMLTTRFFFMYPEKPLSDIVSPVCYLAPNQTASSIFQQFREKKDDSGIVVDEYGSFQGLVTMHDIGEALLGDIPEKQKDSRNIQQTGDHTWEVEGYTRLYMVKEMLSLPWIREYEDQHITLAGMLLNELQHIPREGESVTLHDVKFTITHISHQRIDKVRIERPHNAQPAAVNTGTAPGNAQ
jgi:putative hemolysin